LKSARGHSCLPGAADGEPLTLIIRFESLVEAENLKMGMGFGTVADS
jgi:hypothetical protein